MYSSANSFNILTARTIEDEAIKHRIDFLFSYTKKNINDTKAQQGKHCQEVSTKMGTYQLF